MSIGRGKESPGFWAFCSVLTSGWGLLVSVDDTGIWRGVSVRSSVSRNCKAVGGEDMTGKSLKVYGNIIIQQRPTTQRGPWNGSHMTNKLVTTMNHLSSPTLKHFILRQQVISLYRHAIRASKGKCARSTPLPFFWWPHTQAYQIPWQGRRLSTGFAANLSAIGTLQM